MAYGCGAAIDRPGVVGQLTGGTVHGHGIALTEALRHDGAGSPTAESLLQYRIPTAWDAPDVTVRIIESGRRAMPRGVKGAGEAGVVGTPAAIAAAVRDVLRRAGASPGQTA
ncbi:molybdopterin cofactor-binding domain-containing protein [Micromonospora sp. NPDC048830]|uniref:molybdopterin cofactor-binding domain-containing protein n=1 Tax=Micromonospora sp. NPDC048830 TaxID=3364257 RepID=UPI00371088FE